MRIQVGVLLSCLLLGLVEASSAVTPVDVFERVWKEVQAHVYPSALEEKLTPTEYERLKRIAVAAKNVDELRRPLNDFLATLNVSHTQFLTASDLDFHFLKSLFNGGTIDAPRIRHIGVQLKQVGDNFVVRSVFENGPAAQAGLRRGDVLLRASGQRYEPIESFKGKRGAINIEYRRQGQDFKTSVTPVDESIHFSLLKATKASTRVFPVGSRKVGYFHLWSGTHDLFLEAMKRALQGPLKGVDGLILDLRDGYGGAWHDYLDPFFESRETYFRPTVVSRDGKKANLEVGDRKPGTVFRRPMVVLINEGVRSGKEALAFQLKKTGRAQLVGTRTAGAFVAGRGFFVEENLPYLLFLSIRGMLLDGVDLEGRGVEPDVAVEFPLEGGVSVDPQLEAARAALERTLEKQSK